jgi:putative oxidoreductase
MRPSQPGPSAASCWCSAYSRWVALALVPALLGAIIWAHGSNGWVFTAPNGGWEYPLYLIVLSVAQFLLGDGALALRPARASAPA